jgi:hypothetical protein
LELEDVLIESPLSLMPLVDGVSMREKIARLQDELLKLPQYEPKTQHYFANGMYLRTLWSPAGSRIVGAVHKTEHFYAVLTGHVQVATDEGVIELNANRDGPQILVCPVGTKRAVSVIEDAWRMNVHLNPKNITSVDELELELIEHEERSAFLPGNKTKPEVLSAANDRFDYLRFQAEYGFCQEDILAVVENTADMVPLPDGFDKIELRPSFIQGTGCFTNSDLEAGEVIAPARIDGHRTIAGRYTNHSVTPTCEYRMKDNGDASLCAIGHIKSGTELTVDYRRVGAILNNRPINGEVAKTLAYRLQARGIDIPWSEVCSLSDDLLTEFGYLPHHTYTARGAS